MDDKDLRQTVSASAGMNYYNQCTLGTQAGPQTIIVRQVIAEKEEQKVLDIHVVVPERKPSIEQIVDVLVKDVEIDCVDVITDKVIVRGEFDVKGIYVAALPDQPVHAVEIRHFKWTQDLHMPGVRKGMDADASVIIEFVDYDLDEWTRAYKHKNYEYDDCDTDPHFDDCDTDDDHCGHHHHHDDCDTDDSHCGHHHHDDCDTDDSHCGHHHHHHHDCREFDVSVVLKITAKVMVDREVQVAAAAGEMPSAPKG
ncbi:hypothetical protein P22_1530 [Propionispora sp. 2/2-37]|uniref:DUF3794 domain-containing protein n=1 Tax=Propionispora sp. 2/2-37 TaxID=1677858 RepID=UPI0006BB7941|nr:DUF3794 domain-containing protein [Propionispora sp. 2/2-37]CUH95459.1 hypothetical protein P22_1530 [Propionispora sp. 2/2-37]